MGDMNQPEGNMESLDKFQLALESKVQSLGSFLTGILESLKIQNLFFKDWKSKVESVKATPENKMHEGYAWLLEKRVGTKLFGFMVAENRWFKVRIILAASKMDWSRSGTLSFTLAADASIFELPDSGPLYPGRGISSYEIEFADLDDPSSASMALDVVIRRVFG